MIKKVSSRLGAIFMFFFISFSSLHAEELWLTAGAGAGLMPGSFSDVSFINIDGSTGISLRELFGTDLKTDIELSYAYYIPSDISTDTFSGMHGLQFMLLPAWQFRPGESFILSPRAGIGEQLLFTPSVTDNSTRFGYQLLVQGGLNADFLINDKWTAGIEAAYRMLVEQNTLHHGIVFKIVFGRKLLELTPESKKLPKTEEPSAPETVIEEKITADKLIPLKGMADVLFYETDSSITIILLNSFPANESELTPAAKEHLGAAGEYIDQLDSTDISFYGYVAETLEDDEKYDIQLSRDRASAVKNWLLSNGYISDYKNVEAKGLGAGNPIGDNSTEHGRALNRRVEIAISLDNQE